MMKKLIMTFVVLVMSLVMIPSGNASENWRFCNGVDDKHPQSIALVNLAEDFEKATDGRIKIDVYFSNSLGSEEELLELTRTNTIQGFFGNVTSGLPTFMEEFGVFALPYLFQSYDDAHKYLMESPKQKKLWDKLEQMTQLHFVGDSLNGARALTTKGIDVKSPEDLKGVMVRSMTAQVWQDVISALGATPVPISFPELYMALQTGVVQGQDNGIANVYNSKLYEVQDHFYDTQHGYTLSAFFLNSKAWNSLSDKEKKIFNDLFEKYCVKQYAEDMEKYYAEAREICKNAGMKMYGKEDLDMEAFYANAKKMIDEKYMSNKKYAPTILDIREFLNY